MLALLCPLSELLRQYLRICTSTASTFVLGKQRAGDSGKPRAALPCGRCLCQYLYFCTSKASKLSRTAQEVQTSREVARTLCPLSERCTFVLVDTSP